MVPPIVTGWMHYSKADSLSQIPDHPTRTFGSRTDASESDWVN